MRGLKREANPCTRNPVRLCKRSAGRRSFRFLDFQICQKYNCFVILFHIILGLLSRGSSVFKVFKIQASMSYFEKAACRSTGDSFLQEEGGYNRIYSRIAQRVKYKSLYTSRVSRQGNSGFQKASDGDAL